MLQYQVNFERLKVTNEQHKLLTILEDILVYLITKKPRTKFQLHFDDLNLVNDRYFKNRIENLIKDDYISELRPYSDSSAIMNTDNLTDFAQRIPNNLLNESSIDNCQFGQHNIPCKKEYIQILNDCKDYIIELQEYLVGTLKLNQVPIVELVDEQINIYCNQEGFLVIKQAKEYLQSIYFTKIPNNDSIIPQYVEYLLQQPFLHCAQYNDRSTIRNQKQDTFIIYGKSEEAQLKIQQLENIYSVEVYVSMFRIFSLLFIPKIIDWSRKHYLLIIQTDQDEVYKLVGPYHQVIQVQEAIMTEFRKFDISIGPLKLREITRDQFNMIQVDKYFQNQPNIHENLSQDDLQKNYLQTLSNQSFQACLFVEFSNKCIYEKNSILQCNFHHPEIQNLIQMEMESEAQRVADQQITGSCVIYFIIVQGSVRKLEFKRQFTEYLTLVDVVINDPFLSKQFYSDYSKTTEYEDKFHVEIDCKPNKVYIKGRKEDTDRLIKDLEDHCFFNQSVKDVFDFESEFYWRTCRCVYQDKLNELEQLYQCVIEKLENPQVKLKATRKNMGIVKQELANLLDIIRNYILCCEVKINRNAKCKVRDLIREIEKKYQALEIIDGDCQGGRLVPQFQYKMNKSVIKVCAGSPMQLLSLKAELSQFQDAVFITFSLKDNQNRHGWEQELKALGKMVTISGEQTQQSFNSAKIQVKWDKMVSAEQDDFQELVFKENKKKKQKEKQKEQELIIQMEFYKIWTTDMSNPIYYHTYFDKITMQRSFEEAMISVFFQKSPNKLFISIPEDQDFKQVIKEFIMNLDKYGNKKVEIYLIANCQYQIDDLSEEISTIQGIKEENSDKMKKITQSFLLRAHSKITLECAVEDLTTQLS